MTSTNNKDGNVSGKECHDRLIQNLQLASERLNQAECLISVLWEYSKNVDINTLETLAFPCLHLADETVSQGKDSLLAFTKQRMEAGLRRTDNESTIHGIIVLLDHMIEAALKLEKDQASGDLEGAIQKVWEIASELGETPATPDRLLPCLMEVA